MAHCGVAQAYFERHLVSDNDQNDTEIAIRAASKNDAKLNYFEHENTWNLYRRQEDS